MTGSGPQRVATTAQQPAAASAPERPQLKRHFFRCGDLQYGSAAEIRVEEEMQGRKRITFVSCTAACSTTKNDSNVFLFPNSVPVECALAQAENARPEALRSITDDSTPQQASAPMFLDWEQHLLIDYALNYLNPTHTIVVNGDPGTGKSTVMYHLFNRFARPACAVPTNKVRHKLTNSQSRNCPMTLRTMTLSACVRRLGNFKCSPRVYTAFVERKLHEAIQRFAVLQHRGLYNVDLIDVSRNKKAVNMRPPDCLFVDECNMCSWRQLGFVAEAARRLDVSVMMFGDSGQNRPIGAPDDNADMISLNSSLIVQLLNNKRLKEMRNEQSTDGLASVLRDNVWNVVSTEDNLETTAAVGSYVRQLLLERLDAPLFDAAEIDLTADVELWLRDIATLDRFYAKNPCARYVRNVYALNALVRLHPRVSMPFLIAQRNTVCDRFNYWYALAFLCAARNAMERSCSHWYARACRRTAYLQFTSLNQIGSQHATFKTCIDMTGEQLANGEISDDPWCSVLLLCVGMLYHYIGTNPRIPPNCLLRLIAILPDEDDREFTCTKQNCSPCRLLLLRRQPPPARKPTVSRLLMETVCESGESAKQQFFTVLPEYYVPNRYYSLWTSTPGGHNPREGSRLLGYPLRLAANLTSFKVQGETLDTELYSAVHIDLANMGRQSTLVSLSRLSTSSQLRSILNADQCCP